MYTIRTFLIVCLWFVITTGHCQIRLPKLISDGAVLQRETPLKLWGWASPGEQVELQFKGKRYRTRTDREGKWEISLPAQPVGGPFEMVFSGKNRVVLHDLLFGDVWVCSGQSNMELTMQRVRDEYPGIIAEYDNAQIRQFLVPDRYDFNKEYDDLEGGSWKEARPANIREFSAVAFFFAKAINERYQVPVGLINAALGGSPIEAWMSEAALKQFPDAYEELQKFKDDRLIEEIQQQDQRRSASWYRQINQQDKGLTEGAEWYQKNIDDEDWDAMEIPGFWAEEALGAVNGSVWFRKKISIPQRMAGKEANLWLGRIVDRDSVYVNGRFIGTTGYQYPPRKYVVDPTVLKPGENTLAVRVINEQGKGGFIEDKPYFLAVGEDTIDLKGVWKYRLGTTMEPLESQTFIRWKAGGLYKKMIAPLLNYKIKGVIWYQGESNTNTPDRYFKTFPALIRDWRNHWQQGDFPFIYVQLANFMETTDQPVESNWAELRQAQLETLSVPNAGMAVTIDLGEWNDVHPLNKLDVGKRLAFEAGRLAYGESLKAAPASPVPQRYEFSNGKVRIEFKNAGGGLIAKNGDPLAYFEISQDGKTFVKADAKIKGNNVMVWKAGVDHPVAVRYAWADNPDKANLYSKAGLPASPFEVRKGQ